MIKNLSSEDFDDFTGEGNSIIDFYADWCGPCKIMEPHFEEASEKIKGVRFGKVNVDSNPEIAGMFDVMSIPTTILFKDGEQVERHTGAMDFDEIKELIENNF